MATDGYWLRNRISRRTGLRGAMLGGAGAAALGIVGCGDSNSGGPSNSSATTKANDAPVDTTKGIPGGAFKVGFVGPPANLSVIGGGSKVSGFTHSGLLDYKWGRTGTPGTTIDLEPDLAKALPEQTDDITYVFKLQPAKFHNGRVLTAQDVKYSFDQFALSDQSATKTTWTPWYDKTETPDAETVVVKTKGPYAFTAQSLTIYNDAFILAKEFEESADAASGVVGSGPFIFVDYTRPVSVRFKRNPDYFMKPYPYFDTAEMLFHPDASKQIADFISKQFHLTPWISEAARDEIKKSRPDAQVFTYNVQGNVVYGRTDQTPFNDKRVRQALSMGLNRKAIREAISQGEGKPDQALSLANAAYPFHEVKDLGQASKYWDFNVAEAKKLMTAAGYDKGVDTQLTHWDPATRQSTVDMAVLAEAQWKDGGLGNVKDLMQIYAQFQTTVARGNYDGLAIGPGIINPIIGPQVRNLYWAPPEGVKAPTTNTGYVNNPQLTSLVEKIMVNLKAEERTQIWRQIEAILAEEQYRVVFDAYTNNYLADPALQHINVTMYAVAGAQPYYKYWWFGKA